MDYDLIVIGGGPAGMMAAGRAAATVGQAAQGVRILLLEKNTSLGKKLLLTGKGRCNITNAETDVKKFIAEFGPKGKFLFSSLSRFGVSETVDFFENLGVKTKVERGNRVFPASDRSADVLNALIKYLKINKVEIRTGAEVKSIIVEENEIKKIILSDGRELAAKNYVLCSGGKSYPLTGSNGDGYKWLAKMRHTVILPRPALVPVIVKEKWIKELEGLSLKNVEISVWKKDKKIDSRFGEALFTDQGLSGPIVLDLSGKIGELLRNLSVAGDSAKGRGPEGVLRPVELKIDFKPALDFKTLDSRLQRDFQKFNNKMFKNSLDELLPQKLIPIIVRLSGVAPEKKVNSITKEERNRLVHLLKEFSLGVVRLDSWDKAIITAGGVDLKEIDPKTMRSKIVKNLYLAGEILDLTGPTGGYNLQVCWSTGYAAGENFIK